MAQESESEKSKRENEEREFDKLPKPEQDKILDDIIKNAER